MWRSAPYRVTTVFLQVPSGRSGPSVVMTCMQRSTRKVCSLSVSASMIIHSPDDVVGFQPEDPGPAQTSVPGHQASQRCVNLNVDAMIGCDKHHAFLLDVLNRVSVRIAGCPPSQDNELWACFGLWCFVFPAPCCRYQVPSSPLFVGAALEQVCSRYTSNNDGCYIRTMCVRLCRWLCLVSE